MKKLGLILCLLAVTFSLFAGGSKETTSDDALDIRVLVWKYDDTYGSTVRAAMDKWAKHYSQELGKEIKLTMYDAADDMAKQIEQATIIVGDKPDFVIINLAEVANGQVLVDMFQANDIPFLFYNKQPAAETTKAVLEDTGTIFIGTLARQAGDMQGQILYDLYNADKSIDKNGDGVLQYIMFMGEPNNDEAIARTRYSVETAKELGLKLEAVSDTLVCNWDQALAQEAMTATWASVGNKIEVIFANNDMMALGAVAALNAYGFNTGKAGDPEVVVIGVDAIDAALESIKNGGMTATVQQDGDAMGKANIRIAYNGAMGKEWLDGTEYTYTTEDAFNCIRIPYAMITEVK
ncbi:MAG: galactose ABC transporter substrate-binding protein [Sphaerochaetaceae bacterium]|nr:galactose ABC transporter substrate-binding protein [Sphaerochaetaceae bacterium]NLO61435.1 substrate-binding domain-containing protein [Spirochaetales bacterium]MDD2406290.1 galactose ABC transporter substrate-binding protein [Sphaerochaetaceae bacterium]MDD4258565.1 galactose ABC transporter substrate-binding protein [Sphaerochaetaceae bacterium]MDD4762744.1 galactose ABC transporter substrate-binding protein [Sphaerochaetaceae bacterium]